VRLPPRRERPDDIIPLTEWFLSREVERLGKSPSKFTAEVLEVMKSYGWPGNVRELKGVVEYGALMSHGETIERADLPKSMLESSSVA
jgi:DNA-binding NtrC family response regulator